MRVRCIALYIDFLLYNPLYRLYIEIFLYSAIKYDFAGSSVGLPTGCPAGADDRFG